MCKWSTMRNIPYQCANLCFNCFNLDASKQAHLLIKVSLWPTCRYIRCIQISDTSWITSLEPFFSNIKRADSIMFHPENPGYTTHSLKMGVVVAKICRGSSAISLVEEFLGSARSDSGDFVRRKNQPLSQSMSQIHLISGDIRQIYFNWVLHHIC